MDREKVINELVEHIESALAIDSDYVDCVRTDLLQYTVALLKEQQEEIENLKQAAQSMMEGICLLKEQEAVKPIKGKTPDDSAFDCGACGYPLWEDENYCAHCGKPILWEGR